MNKSKKVLLVLILLFLQEVALSSDVEVGVLAENYLSELVRWGEERRKYLIKEPSQDGDRFIRVLTKNNMKFFQEKIRDVGDIPEDYSGRLVLQYSMSPRFGDTHEIIPKIDGRTVEAILPQDQTHPCYDQAFIDHIKSQTGNASHFEGLNLHPLSECLHKNPMLIKYGNKVFYRWKLQKRNGSVVLGDKHDFIMPHPLVFGIMGDSYGAGEGAPDTMDGDYNNAEWADKNSHRSKYTSGLVKGVLNYIHKNPSVWVEYKHVAISGATISESLSAGYTKHYGPANRELKLLGTPIPIPQRYNITVKPQLNRLEEWYADNGYERMHVLLLSAGGNDLQFTKTIQNAVIGSLSLDFGKTLSDFELHARKLRESVKRDFHKKINQFLKPMKILWVNYPDPTIDQNGEHSGIDVEPTLNFGILLLTQSVGAGDMRNAHILLTDYLNPTIEDICREGYWKGRCKIIDVEGNARKHGVNANKENRWFNNFLDSQDMVQGSIDGSVHPNKTGYDRI